MRPKETYTKEEYMELKRQLLAVQERNRHLEQELENANKFIQYLQARDNGKNYAEVQRIIEEENQKREQNALFIKYPYYKELKDYVEMGITEIPQLMQLIGKSRSAVYQALHAMGLFPLEKKDKSKLKLAI